MRREVAAGGKGRLLVNGSPAALKTLQEIAPRLLVLHGQAEARDLLDPDAPRELLDRYAGLEEKSAAAAALFREWRARQGEVERLEGAAADRAKRLELLDFQIDGDRRGQARRGRGRERFLLKERNWRASRRSASSSPTATGALESDESGAIIARLRPRGALFNNSKKSTLRTPPEAPSLAGAIETMLQVAFETSRDLESLEADPARAAFVAERLDALAKLKRKYGPALADVLARREALGRERDELNDLEGAVRKAEDASEKAFAAYRRAALDLSAAREAAAPRLGRAVEAHLRDLAFLKSSFSAAVARREEEGSRFVGGRPPRLVRRARHRPGGVRLRPESRRACPAAPEDRLGRRAVARPARARRGPRRRGGGERGERGPARRRGPSGRSSSTKSTRASRAPRPRPWAGSCAASRRRSRSSSSRISRRWRRPGERHFSVSKEAAKGRTRTRVEALDGGGRVEAVAALLAGASVGEAARAQARQLLARLHGPRTEPPAARRPA